MADDVTSAAHAVQLALTPIFLLAGIGSLLNVFTVRLGRVADRVDQLARAEVGDTAQLRRLRLRSRALDLAVLLAAAAGALTCAAALTLILGKLHQGGGGRVLLALFGAALGCAMGAIASFSFEMLLAGRTVRETAKAEQDRASGP